MERGSEDGGRGGRGKLESCVELLRGVKRVWGERVGLGGEGGVAKEENKADHVSGKGVWGWREGWEGRTGGCEGASMGHKGDIKLGVKIGERTPESGEEGMGVQGTPGVRKWGQEWGE